MRLRGWGIVFAIGLLIQLIGASAAAHEEHPVRPAAPSSAQQDAIVDDFEVLGHVRFPGKNPEADVYFEHRGKRSYAYVGTFQVFCTGTGVKIVDVTDPGSAETVGEARLRTDQVSYEDVVAVEIDDRHVLAVGIQPCGEARGGLALFDVTRARRPVKLSFTRMPSNGVHELDIALRPDGRVLALLAVPFAEAAGAGGDLRIVDISDPAAPERLGTWGIFEDSPLTATSLTDPATPQPDLSEPRQGQGSSPLVFGHSVRAADEGMTAYVSYMDGGELKIDITDPEQPVLVGRTTFPYDADGDAHSATVVDVQGTRFLLQNDEDLDPLSPPHITSSATGSTSWAGVQQFLPTTLASSGAVVAQLHDANDGCEPSDYTGAAGKTVLVDSYDPRFSESVPCPVGAQVVSSAEAGAAALIMSFVGPQRPTAFATFDFEYLDQIFEVAEGMPGVAVASVDGLADALRSAPGNAVPEVTLDPATSGWGFLRIFDESAGSDADGDGISEFEQVGSFAGLPHVAGEAVAPPGTWSIHNSEVVGDRLYASWYSHGIVALDISDPAQPVLVGQFSKPSERRFEAFDVLFGAGNFAWTWGVAVDPVTGTVYASDGKTGLWILRPVGDAAS